MKASANAERHPGLKKRFFLKKAQPSGFWGFFGQAGKIGKIIQKLSNLKPLKH